MRTTVRSVLLSLCLIGLATLTSGCARIAGGYQIPAGATPLRSYSSIAGGIEVGARAQVHDVETIAGEITIGEGTRVRAVESIAGEISLADNVTVERSVETVAGNIDISRGCTIGGDVETVAGEISIRGSEVRGDVILRHGELDIDQSLVVGAVRIKRRKDKNAERTKVTIRAGSEIGEVVVDEKVDLRLRIHRSAKVGPIRGATAEYFD